MKRESAFTLAEMMIALGASVVIMAGLIVGSVGIQRTLHNSEVFAAYYTSARRLIDCVSRDLRRSAAIQVMTASGATVPANGQSVTLSDQASVTLVLPGYYLSNEPGTTGYDQPLAVVNTNIGPTYGSGSTPAPTVTVTFRKFFSAEERCVCFVREEEGVRQTLVRQADKLNVTLSFSPDGRTCTVEAWFKSPFSPDQQDVATCDRVMLRNGLPP